MYTIQGYLTGLGTWTDNTNDNNMKNSEER